jgi:hypothetical protein
VQWHGQAAIFSLAIIPLFVLLVVGVVVSFGDLPDAAETSVVVERMNEAFLSVLGIVLLVLVATLLLDAVGYELQVRSYEEHIGKRFDAAAHLAKEIAVAHVREHALRLSDPWFTTAADSVKELATRASACHDAFSEALAQWREESKQRSDEARGKLLDNSDSRPLFSPFFSFDELYEYYSRRLGEEPSDEAYARARRALAEALANETTAIAFKSWRNEDGGTMMADEAKRLMASSVSGVLRPNLPHEFFGDARAIAHPIFENYARPYWHFTAAVQGLRSREMVLAPGQLDLVNSRFPEAEPVENPVSATTIALMCFVYGLPLDVFPEWGYLNGEGTRAAKVPTGLGRASPDKVPKHLQT